MDKLEALREKLRAHNVYAYLIPRSDEFQGEFVPAYAERLKWLTGFSGSAGIAVVTLDQAAFFTDARYTTQAGQEINTESFQIFNGYETPPHQWLKSVWKRGKKVAYDPWLHTKPQIQRYINAGLSLLPLETNLVDQIWEDQPKRSLDFIRVHPLTFAGESHLSKRKRVGEILTKNEIDKLLITSSDAIAWILNIRGREVPHNPIVHAYLLLDKSGTFDLFVDLQKINGEVFNHLNKDGRLIAIQKICHHLQTLPKELSLQVERSTCPMALIHALEKAHVKIHEGEDPCELLKAIKNPAEIEGAYQAHIEDGIALCRFLSWLDEQPLKGETTELSASQQLQTFRQAGQHFMDLSFETISAYGPNSSLIHYHPHPSHNALLKRESIYLVDSGGQYLTGTTDVTRTIALGPPTSEQIDRFTRVLKGHIALAMICFPKGTSGLQLDAFARHHLWQLGLDYEHGTGHGVGSYLSVHEGPQGISRGYSLTPLQAGMILSNEPGYYKANEYGIRIESMMVVVEDPDHSQDKPFLKFDTLTLAPLDQSLINPKLLDQIELDWLNAYHRRVKETLSPRVDEKTRLWLEQATQPIKY